MSGDNPCPRRLNIAVLLDHLNFFGRGYEGQLRDALYRRCRASGHNLVLVYGGALDEPTVLSSADNVIFRVLRPDHFDGFIVASALLSTFCGAQGVERLVQKYQGAHLCSVGTAIPGVPSLVLDNTAGMDAAVEHLVREHGCRQPAFLAGTPHNPEADARFAAYRAVLERHGLPFDPSRVASGQFLPALGRLAMDQILDRGVPFDAVVAANDSMAIGAIQALRQRGMRVPRDIPVTGFDDLTLARLGNPPLTTIAQPFDRFADLAVACIEDQILGRPVAPLTEIPSHFVRRQSCGCGHREGASPTGSRPGRDVQGLTTRVRSLRPLLADILQSGIDDSADAASTLSDGLGAEIAGEKDAFQTAVGTLLANGHDDGERRRSLLGAINLLRNDLTGDVDVRLERAFYDALSLVATTNTAAQVQHRLDLDESGEQASTAFDLASLRDSLMRALPAAGVKTALLSCVGEGSGNELESLVYMIDGVSRGSRRIRFPAGMLLPPDVRQLERQSTFLVFPLVHEQELLGVIAFDHSDGNNPYIAFRNQIAVVLRNIRLHQEVLRKTMLHERSVQDRLSAAKRFEALSVLAGGVAHDLNNALGPMLAVPDIIMAQLGRLVADPDALDGLREDVDSIKTAAQRAAQTIKDLLTLGRQGRRAKAALDLNRLVKSCLLASPWAAGNDAKIELRLELAAEPLPLNGAESQLARAVSNLLRNALEAVDGHGQVRVATSRAQLASARAGFETIPAGEYIVLTISDTGCGIPSEDMDRVFEPFFTSKRSGEDSGTGLGLAIVMGVVKEHEGYIDVASRVGVGTTFTIYLPAGAALPRADAKAPAPRGHARLLVIDDDEAQLRTYRRVLSHLGYAVETSSSGGRACELFKEAAAKGDKPFDLVLVDMLLGEALDGLQVVEQLQALVPKQKAIIVSGHAPNERTDNAIRSGLAWLSKPYDIDSLANVIAETLNRNIN